MIGIFIEPPSVYYDRHAKSGHATTANPATSDPAPVQPAAKSGNAYWTDILIETLKLEGDVPVPLTTLVNSAAKWGDYGCRADRESRKLALFRLIGQLIKQGRLRRVARNYVLLATDDELKRHQGSLSKLAPPLDLPAPTV
jgi:hypothetical protein